MLCVTALSGDYRFGGGHTGAMTAGIVATGLIFFPAAPFFLFMHGKNISIPKGTEVPTFVNGNFHLDLSKFKPASETAQSSADGKAEVAMTSEPSGAEITLDGSFVGNTPSTIGIAPGQHTIDISKSGFVTWTRTLSVTSGRIEISAQLEATPELLMPLSSSIYRLFSARSHSPRARVVSSLATFSAASHARKT